MSETRIVECRIPVFVAAADVDNEDQAVAWYGGKYTIAAGDTSRRVEYRISGAYDNTGEYARGEMYPINTTQVVVTSRSDNPALATLKMNSLDWETYTRPDSVQVIYEEKRGVSMEVAVSLGLLCNRITSVAQEKATNPLSTLIFSPADTKTIDEERKARGEPTEIDGYKRYTGVITIPYGERKVKNAVNGRSLPGAATGVDADRTGYNITTDLFFANVYFRQVTNTLRALKVGEHVGFLTFKFATTFSGYRGPINSIIVSSYADKVIGHTDYPASSFAVREDLSSMYQEVKTDDDIVVTGPCTFVRRGGKTTYVGDRMRVPLSNGLFAMVRKPEGMQVGSAEMRRLFADTWRRKKDPRYERYQKEMKEIAMHRTALKAIRREFGVARNDEEENRLSLEYDSVRDNLSKAEKRVGELMRTDFAMITEASRGRPLVTADKKMQIMKPLPEWDASFEDVCDFLSEIQSGDISEPLKFSKKVKFQYDGKGYEAKAEVTEFGSDTIAEAFFNIGAASTLAGMQVGSSLVLPALFPYGAYSAGAVGGGLCVRMFEGIVEPEATFDPVTVQYNGSAEIEYEAGDKGYTLKVGNDYDVELRNMFPAPYALIDEKTTDFMVTSSKISFQWYDNSTGKEEIIFGGGSFSSRSKREIGKVARKMALRAGEKNDKVYEFLYTGSFLRRDTTKDGESEIEKMLTERQMSNVFWSGPLVVTSPYVLKTAGAESRGLLRESFKASFNGYSCVFVHARNSKNEWWSPGQTGTLLSEDATIADTGVKVADLVGEIDYNVRRRLVCSNVPIYHKEWPSRCVQMNEAKVDWEAAEVKMVALGPEFEMKVGDDTRTGGVCIQLIGHEEIDEASTVTLPGEMPDGKGGKRPVDDTTRYYFHHVVDSIIEFWPEEKEKITGDWEVAYTVIRDMPYRMPNFACTDEGRKRKADEVVIDVPPVTVSHFESSVVNYAPSATYIIRE